MNKLQQYIAFTTVAVLGVLAAGWFLLVSPLRADAAELDTQTAAQAAAAASLRVQIATLAAQTRDVPKAQAELDAAAVKIPAAADMPAWIRALTAAASRSGVEFLSLTPGSATTPGAGGSVPSAAAVAAAPYQVLTVTISVYGSYPQVQQYLGALEDLPRAFRLSQLAIAPAANPVATSEAAAAAVLTDGSGLLSSITGQLYVAAPTATALPATAAKANQETR